MGDLTIRVLEARNLIPADRNGKSDPYVTVEILEDPMQKKQKTRCHHKTLNPVWQETFHFRAPAMTNTILFKVWDRDLFKRNDPLGNVNIYVNRLTPGAPNNMWLDLQGVPTGQLHVEIIFVPAMQAGGGMRPAGQFSQIPQQMIQPPQQMNQPSAGQYYPPQMPAGAGFKQPPTGSYPPPMQAYPQGAVSNNPAPFPQPNTLSGPPNPTMSYPAPSPVNSGYAQPPTSSYNPTATGSYNPPLARTASYQAPPTPTASYQSPPTLTAMPTASVGQDDDVGVDYSKIASQFSMNPGYQQPPPPTAYSSQPNYTQQPPPASYPPQTQSYPPQAQSYAPVYQQQPGYPPQQQQQQQGGYPPQPVGYPPQQAGGYPQGYAQPQGYTQGTQMVTAQGLVAGPKLTKFFVDIRKRLNRDYIVIMDMSGSMSGLRWQQAKDATMKIAPFACQADPDGITLYLFNGRYTKHEHLTQAGQVQAIFSREHPSGTTNLAGVLQAAFSEHFSGNKPTTILVITDGEPDSQAATASTIVRASQRLNSQEDLSISFIQIGNDHSATKFLRFLDDSLKTQGARFDIVDTVSANDLGAMTFDQLIEKSIYD